MAKLIIFTFLLLIVITIFINQVSSNDQVYCKIKNCDPGTQSACKYDAGNYPAACGPEDRIISGVTDQHKKEILAVHNKQRAYVASGKELHSKGGALPKGKIPPLQWDDELAYIAQRWADQCQHGHDECRNVERFQVGQNYASKGSSGTYSNNITDMILSQWYSEVKNFYPEDVKDFMSQSTGHFSQLIWADSKYIGCGIIKFYKNNYMYTTNLFCNYGPTGNYPHRSVYQTK